MRAWRKEHPKARYVEIDAELESRIKGLREEVLGEIIGMSAVTEAEGQIVHCPVCGTGMMGRGKHQNINQSNLINL